MEMLFRELVVACSSRNVPLSAEIQSKINNLNTDDRLKLVSTIWQGQAPLFIACFHGNAHIVTYLVEECKADKEQLGEFVVSSQDSNCFRQNNTTHLVTPLWCAAVQGHIDVVGYLILQKANINAASDTGSTPVRSACFMSHVKIVKLLAGSGANIHRPNYNGGTCLINSVQSKTLCTFLIKHGADVNSKDIQLKTALHYAIQEDEFETVKLLLEYDADPYARTKYNDDALQTACFKGASLICQHLMDHYYYSAQRKADAFELLGCTFLNEFNDVSEAIYYWTKALQFRHRELAYPVESTASTPDGGAAADQQPPSSGIRDWPIFSSVFSHHEEFQTEAELRAMSHNIACLRIHAVLLAERILTSSHMQFCNVLMHQGAAFAEGKRFRQCFVLWCYALELRAAKYTILYGETCFNVQAIVRLCLDMYHDRYYVGKQDGHSVFTGNAVIATHEQLTFSDMLHTTNVIVSQIKMVQELLQARPVYKRQHDCYDKVLKCLGGLFCLLIVTSDSEEDLKKVQELVFSTVAFKPRVNSLGESLLHLVIVIKRQLPFIRPTTICDHPVAMVMQWLIQAGIPVDVYNNELATPLLYASRVCFYQEAVVQLLLREHAHLDQIDKYGDMPLRALATRDAASISIMKYISLTCLAAGVIRRYGIPYEGIVPHRLAEFVKRHSPNPIHTLFMRRRRR